MLPVLGILVVAGLASSGTTIPAAILLREGERQDRGDGS